jgi:chromosome segregation ATPase
MNAGDARELVDNLSVALSASLNVYHEAVEELRHDLRQRAGRDEEMTLANNQLAKENRELREALDKMAERYEQTKIQSDEQDNDMRQLQAERAGFRSQLEQALAQVRDCETKLRDNEAERIEFASQAELTRVAMKREIDRLQALEYEAGTLRTRNRLLIEIENATGLRGRAVAQRVNRMQPVHRAIFDYYEDDGSDLDTLLEALSAYYLSFED